MTTTLAHQLDDKSDWAAVVAEMHKCLDISHQIIRLCHDSSKDKSNPREEAMSKLLGVEVSGVDADAVNAIFAQHGIKFGPVLEVAMAGRLQRTIGEAGFSSCAINEFGHALHHLIYDSVLREKLLAGEEPEPDPRMN